MIVLRLLFLFTLSTNRCLSERNNTILVEPQLAGNGNPPNGSQALQDLKYFLIEQLNDTILEHPNHLLLCNCTAKDCDSEFTALDFNLSGICLARRGACRRSIRRLVDVNGTYIGDEELLNCVNGLEFEMYVDPCGESQYFHHACCYDPLCNPALTVKPLPPWSPSDDSYEDLVYQSNRKKLPRWFLVLPFILSAFGAIAGSCLNRKYREVVHYYRCLLERNRLWEPFYKWFIGMDSLIAEIEGERARTSASQTTNAYARLSTGTSTVGHGVEHEDSYERQGRTGDHDVQPMLSKGVTMSTLLTEANSSSGSGAGTSMLVRRTVALQIELKECIGRGRFGEVRLGIWKGDAVAVKIFNSRDEQSWEREVEMYNSLMLASENLLRVLSWDKKDTGVSTELWLITDYYACGSLYDFLCKEVVDEITAVQLIHSLCKGLRYLHSERKPAIAHRDLKSKNILVRKDMTCVIADLGLAVRYWNGQLDIPGNTKCGTVRYLAPEVLDESICNWKKMGDYHGQFLYFRRADIYSLSLVMWEVAMRTQCDSSEAVYFDVAIPYHEFIDRDPSIEEMSRPVVYMRYWYNTPVNWVNTIVVHEKRRPPKHEAWEYSDVLDEMYSIMSECWIVDPYCRPTAGNVLKHLEEMCEYGRFTISGLVGSRN